MKFQSNKRLFPVLLSIILFVTSLALPAFYVKQDLPDNEWKGYTALLTGWLAIGSNEDFAYLANPLLVLSWIFYYKNIKGFFLTGILAFLFAGSFMLYNTIIINEAGSTSAITGYGRGYWFWLASTGVMFLAVAVSWYKKKRQSKLETFR